MKTLFNESLLKRFNLMFFPLAIIWTFSTIVEVFLPTSTTEGFTNSFDPFFEIYHFNQKFQLSSSATGSMHTKTITTTTLVPDMHRIKAIYRSGNDAFVSISDAAKSTQVIALGGMYKKIFKLTALSDTVATFHGYGKAYKLRLGHDDPLSRKDVVTTSIPDPAHKEILESEWRTVSHKTLLGQMDMQNLEKNINLSAVAKGMKSAGFRVNSIASESVFAQLGIISGDIILAVNNKKLESYSDALVMYNQVPHLKSIRITVTRNNLQKDLIYEITR
ncbi:MAG: hypothetical protein Q8S36_10875 [Sulfuricurvum sp.]|nr:hypothetical protein [Sulfuricurvum sp.]